MQTIAQEVLSSALLVPTLGAAEAQGNEIESPKRRGRSSRCQTSACPEMRKMSMFQRSGLWTAFGHSRTRSAETERATRLHVALSRCGAAIVFTALIAQIWVGGAAIAQT